jgi:WD40 repeat protein
MVPSENRHEERLVPALPIQPLEKPAWHWNNVYIKGKQMAWRTVLGPAQAAGTAIRSLSGRCGMSCHTYGQILGAAGNLSFVAACLLLSAPLSAQERKPQATLEGHTRAVESLSFSPDGKTLASACTHCSIKLWDVPTGRNRTTLKEESPYLWGWVAFSPDGKMLATGGFFNKVKLWDVRTLKGKILLDERRQCPETVVVFSPDGKTLASGGVCRGEMELFDVASGKSKATLATWKGANPEGVLAMAFTPDGKTLVSAGRPDEIKLWDVATGKNTGTRKAPENFGGTGLFPPPNAAAAFSSDGKRLATTTSKENSITLWEVATGKLQFTLKGHTAYVGSVAFSADGKTLASGCEDGTIKLWDVTGGKELATLKGHAGGVRCLAFSADGKVLGSGSADKTIKLWDMPKAK